MDSISLLLCLLGSSLFSFSLEGSLQLSGRGEKGWARNHLVPKPCCVSESESHMTERVRLVLFCPQATLQDHLIIHFHQLHTVGDTHHLLPLYTPNPVKRSIVPFSQYKQKHVLWNSLVILKITSFVPDPRLCPLHSQPPHLNSPTVQVYGLSVSHRIHKEPHQPYFQLSTMEFCSNGLYVSESKHVPNETYFFPTNTCLFSRTSFWQIITIHPVCKIVTPGVIPNSFLPL